METIATKDIAKQVRKELKAAYPSIKFSVTSSYDKISVSYVDGVPETEIEPFISKYRGYRDLDTYGDYGADTTWQSVMFQGQEVQTRLNYIHVSRSMSERYLTEVLQYVKSTLHDAEFDGVSVEVSQYSGNAYLTGHHHDHYSYYNKIARESSSLEPIKVQCDRIQEKEDRELAEYMAKKEVKTTPMSHFTQLVVTPVSVIDIPVNCHNVEVLDCKFPSLNKCQRLDEYIEQLDDTEMYRAVINRVVKLTDDDYDAWTNDLLHDQEWLSKMGGSDSTANLREVEDWYQYSEAEQKIWIAEAYNLAVLVYAPNRSAILVDPQGYDYARYVGFIEQGLADRYLPKKIFTTESPELIESSPIESNPVTQIEDHQPQNPIDLYSKWVQNKIAESKADKIISFDDWLDITMMALNSAINL